MKRIESVKRSIAIKNNNIDKYNKKWVTTDETGPSITMAINDH